MMDNKHNTSCGKDNTKANCKGCDKEIIACADEFCCSLLKHKNQQIELCVSFLAQCIIMLDKQGLVIPKLKEFMEKRGGQ